MEEMRKAMAKSGEREDADNRRSTSNQGEDLRARWERSVKRIEAAVESGDLTREEADAKHRELRERMGRARARSGERQPKKKSGTVPQVTGRGVSATMGPRATLFEAMTG